MRTIPTKMFAAAIACGVIVSGAGVPGLERIASADAGTGPEQSAPDAAEAIAVPVSGQATGAQTDPSAQAAENAEKPGQVRVATNNVNDSTDNLIVNMKLPVFQGLADTKYQDQLNDLIESHAMKDLENWKKEADEAAASAKESGYTFRPYELYVTYDLKSDGGGKPEGLVSLQMTTYAETGGTGMPRVDHYNFLNVPDTKRLTLADLLGADYESIVNAAVKKEIDAHPDDYFAEQFKGITPEQGFYVQNGEVVIVFPKYEIAPGAAGNPEFRIALPQAGDKETGASGQTGQSGQEGSGQTDQPASSEKPLLTLASDLMFVNGDGVTMVPLRKVAEALGYEIKWDAVTGTAELSRGAQWTSVTMGKDAYFFAKMAPQPLGAAPVIRSNGLSYVPEAFVTDILKARMAKSADGSLDIWLGE